MADGSIKPITPTTWVGVSPEAARCPLLQPAKTGETTWCVTARIHHRSQSEFAFLTTVAASKFSASGGDPALGVTSRRRCCLSVDSNLVTAAVWFASTKPLENIRLRFPKHGPVVNVSPGSLAFHLNFDSIILFSRLMLNYDDY